jgi:outer membrane protein OmpA-like peptidoglycan-associated protein
MKKRSMRLYGATALALLLAAPALAISTADKNFLNLQHEKIVAARAEPGMAQNGLADLDRAEAVLKPLYKDFNNDDRRASPSIVGQIDAMIETARMRNRIAAIKTDIVQLQARGSARMAAAEQSAAAAQRSAAQAQTNAAVSQAETGRLRDQLQNSQDSSAASQAETVRLRDQLQDSRVSSAASEAETVRLRDQLQDSRVSGAASQAETGRLRDQLVVSQASSAASQAESASLRGQLSDYKMKQTQLGATLVLSDVSFATGRANLKSGAVERLRPLANYLQANGDVQVHIDGHTDAQGSATTNQSLSDRRALAVRGNLSGMGVNLGRMEAVGHGEDMPVADNATADGRQQNRRVEITLVGQQIAGLATN